MFCDDVSSSLKDIIIQKIKNDGPISFRDYMEMALYYPKLGYYTSPGEKIGVNGDYFTSPTFTNLYGQLIAKQLEEMWVLLGGGSFTVVEYGAGTGHLSFDILRQLKRNSSLYDHLNYCIIEKSEVMREKEKKLLHEKVRWVDSIDELRGMTGCVLSNELVDNFSVHQVIMCDELLEVYVDYKDAFVEVLLPANRQLKEYFTDLYVNLPKGYRAEVNLQLIDWIKSIATNLDRGFVITVDYGFLSSELFSQKHSQGTVLCYGNHKINDNPYFEVGKQDITAHVNFSALSHWGKLYGLECCGFTDQASFLRSLGLVNHIRNIEEQAKASNSSSMNDVFLLHTLLMDMGKKFKVLIQQKGFQSPGLSGLAFSQKSC